MRHRLNILLSASFLFAIASSSAAQSRPSEFSGLSLGGVPHPVSAALTYWDSLNLSDNQITRLRKISDEFESKAFSVIAAQYADTAALWMLWKQEPIDSIGLVKEARRKIDSEVSLTLAMLRARDEVFQVLTSAQRTRLQQLVRGRLLPAESAASRSRQCGSGSRGGSTQVSDRVEIVYSLTFEGDSAYINSVFVVRADDKLYASPRAVEQPRVSDQPLQLSGATSGRWWLQYDKRGRTAWVHDRRIDLGSNNVVLVQGTDRLNRPPDVVGLAKAPSSFFTGGCRDSRMSQIVKDHVMRIPEVRAFVTSAN